MVKVKAATNDLVVVDLEPSKDVWGWVQLNQGGTCPNIVRVYKDRIEIDVEIELSNGLGMRKKTLKFWLHDLLLMNETLYRIQHPH